MIPGTPVRLTPIARILFPDIGPRPGVLVRVDGWACVRFGDREVRLPVTDVEEVT